VVGRDQQLVVRDQPRRPVDDVAVVDEQAGAGDQRTKLLAYELVDPIARDRHAEEEESQQHRELVGGAEPPQVGRQLG
jgi:hypothetical protein